MHIACCLQNNAVLDKDYYVWELIVLKFRSGLKLNIPNISIFNTKDVEDILMKYICSFEVIELILLNVCLWKNFSFRV